MESIKHSKCPICSKDQTLGNSYNTSKGYICIECLKKSNLKMKVVPEEKDLRCFICSKELTSNNVYVTPTVLICNNCDSTYSSLDLAFSNSKSTSTNLGKVTLTFIVILILIYLLSSIPFFFYANPAVLQLGSFNPVLIDNGQYWRVISSCLLHVDLNHLFFNLFGIIISGYFLESFIGSRSLLILILVSAISSNLFSYYLSPETISVGASGIAYGLFIAFVAYISFQTILKKPKEIKGQLFSLFVLFLLQLFTNYQNAGTVNIYAHLGGAAGGVVFILLYILLHYQKIKKSKSSTML